MEAGLDELLAECGSEGLDAELEGAEVGALVELLHLLGHERLVDRLALRVGSVDCEEEKSQ